MIQLTFNILILGLISSLTFSQSVEIKGKVIDYKSLLPLSGVIIQMTDSIGTITNMNTGEFNLLINKQIESDSIMISYVGNRPLIIRNIPLNENTIDLRTIPMFEGDDVTSMIDFFCGKLDIICKIRERRYWKKERLNSEQKRKETNMIIKNIRYLYNGYLYKLDYSNNDIVIDLSKPIGKWYE